MFAAVPLFSLAVAVLPFAGLERMFEHLPFAGLFVRPRAHANLVECVWF